MTERCHYCSKPMHARGSIPGREDPGSVKTRDHVIPLMMGNSGKVGLRNLRDTPRNIVACCEDCNAIKGDAPVEVFLYFLRNYPQKASRTVRQLAFRQFVYSLTRVGLGAAFAEHDRFERKSSSPPRGRYTLRDLRKKVAAK
jgi:hypothetical protein